MRSKRREIVRAAILVLLILAGCRKSESPAPRRAVPVSGHEVFIRHCQNCHGPEAKGGTPMVSGYPNANLADGKWAHGGTHAEIVQTITQGVPGTPMRPLRGLLTPAEIDAVADYVRSLSGK
jgi:cbb3-type cytochrome c oxidase subunit III